MFMRWTRDDLKNYEQRTKRASVNPWAGRSPQLQKPEDSHSGQPHKKTPNPDRTRHKRTNGSDGKRYRLRVIFRVSDQRRRDAFGMLETVADILIRAVRRFNPPDPMR